MDSSASKPVMLITHSRSCSTVIERIFWANNDIKCYHEHFGDAFYFGPEKISENWKHWPEDRIPKTGKAHVTYKIALEDILSIQKPQRYVFNKDMSYHIVPPKNSNVSQIPSLLGWDDAAAESQPNPTWLPVSALNSFRYAFLIRSPWLAVPSLYRLHVPPAVHETMEPIFRPAEIGYREIRVLIEYFHPQLRSDASDNTKDASSHEPVLIDATDVLAAPEDMLQQLCDRVGLPFSHSMLRWNPHNADMEKEFSKFPGFHSDAIKSSGLQARTKDEVERSKARGFGDGPPKKHSQDAMGMEMTETEYIQEWTSRYGEEAAGKILEAVNLCKDDYVWLKQLTIRPLSISQSSE